MIAQRLRRPFMPWQRYVADVALELNTDGSLVYGEVDLEVGRQEGKTELKFVIAVTRLTAMVLTHGPQRATYTMQNRKKARMRLERDYAQRLRSARGFTEIDPKSRRRPTKQVEWRLGMNSGVEAIQFGPASYLQIDTPSRTDGHGDTLDAGFIDEAFAHEDNTVELGMEPAMLTRRDAQLWVFSAAGDPRSKYLWGKVLRGRKLIEEGADTGVAYFEWSAEDDDEPGDPDTWRRACPALGHTVTEARLAALWEKALKGGPSDIDAFRRSYLCQWPQIPVLGDEFGRWLVIPEGAWFARADVAHRPTGELRYCLDVDQNESGVEWASIACSDGTHVELVTPPEVGPGVGWVVDRVRERRDQVGELLVLPDGPAGRLIPALEQAGVKVRKVKPAELAEASAGFVDAVIDGEVRHIDQPRLNAAVAGVERRDVGDGAWRFSRKRSSVDISPLVAVAVARWAAQSGSSRYEERGMTVLG